jgi:predicted DNA-binding helix-hairpin-helix protein
MEIDQKLLALSQDAQFDVCSPTEPQVSRREADLLRSITPTRLPDGRVEPRLKVLLSNACEKDCAYCANRCARAFRRVTFRPDELARAFYEMWRARLVTGLFLSSAVIGNWSITMERMMSTVEILRQRYDYRGYIHLKLMPGTDKATVERAVRLADRVSVNLEAPSPARLAALAGKKSFYEELVAPLRWVTEIRRREGGDLVPLGHTTQLVVGAADESDKEILTTAAGLYRELGLARVFYSAFRPIEDTPLENHPATPPLRQHRLYQSDLLLRRYGFGLDELPFDQGDNLPLDADPKVLAALRQPHRFPVEINTAPRRELLRVPGIGPRSAARIVESRHYGAFHSLTDLKQVGASVQRAAPFILLDGRRPSFQLRLF